MLLNILSKLFQVSRYLFFYLLMMLSLARRPVEEGRINGAGDVPVTNAAAVAVAEGDDENHDWRKACGPLKVLERRFSRLANVKTPIIDSGDLPVNW